ncbi:hypothetical protein HOY80DRAFT_570956 [Tuber brumale]|nr:hypothetical protein HOY80DRAFT_570956 [Tuber brumale]
MRREELEYHTSEYELSRADRREGGVRRRMEIIVFSIEAMYVSCGLYAALHALDHPCAHSIGPPGCQASEGPPHIEISNKKRLERCGGSSKFGRGESWITKRGEFAVTFVVVKSGVVCYCCAVDWEKGKWRSRGGGGDGSPSSRLLYCFSSAAAAAAATFPVMILLKVLLP